MDDFRLKYFKYKAKYLKLKKMLVVKKMTPRQRQIIKLMVSNDGSYAILHKRNTVNCFRVLSENHEPLMNVRFDVFRRLMKAHYFKAKEMSGMKTFILSTKSKNLKFRNNQKNEG